MKKILAIIVVFSVFILMGDAFAGSIFLSGHDPDFHAVVGSNAIGAQHINRTAISYVMDPSFNRYVAGGINKFLFVESAISVPQGHVDGKAGIIASGYVEGVDFDTRSAATLNAALNNLGTTYSAIVVASDFGGILSQAELDILNARASDIITFLNNGGGLYAMAESNGADGGVAGLTPTGNHYGFLPFIISNTALPQQETANTVTPLGASLGLTNSDVNGNFSHNIFLGTSGLSVVDMNAQGGILSMAGRLNNIPTPGTLYASFGSGGTWIWNGSSWSKLTASDPENLVASGSFLYADFGSSGTWLWNGSNWSKLTASDPENLVASGSFLYADFGSSGTWMWNGSNWSKLTASNPENLVASGSLLYADFGSSGTWMWNGSNWSKLTTLNPENLAASGSLLYGDFGSFGTWLWDGSIWTQLTASNPDNLVVSGSLLYASFGSSGTWLWNGSNWSKLTTSDPDNLVASGSYLYADFGSSGTWLWNGSNWSKLTTSNPENMVASGSLLYADFGSAGTWLWNGSSWTQLTLSDPDNMVVPF